MTSTCQIIDCAVMTAPPANQALKPQALTPHKTLGWRRILQCQTVNTALLWNDAPPKTTTLHWDDAPTK
jgi:hypothetical protein